VVKLFAIAKQALPFCALTSGWFDEPQQFLSSAPTQLRLRLRASLRSDAVHPS